MPGQDNSCGATLLDDKIVRLARTNIRRLLITESPIPSHILRKAFLLALGSPFSLTFSAAIPPAATLFKRSGKTYSLFLNGL